MPVEYAVVPVEPKTPISLRLPNDIVETVTAYALENGIRKTDAYIHFLELGIQQEYGDDNVASRLDEISQDLARALEMLEKLSD